MAEEETIDEGQRNQIRLSTEKNNRMTMNRAEKQIDDSSVPFLKKAAEFMNKSSRVLDSSIRYFFAHDLSICIASRSQTKFLEEHDIFNYLFNYRSTSFSMSGHSESRRKEWWKGGSTGDTIHLVDRSFSQYVRPHLTLKIVIYCALSVSNEAIESLIS